MHIFLSLSKFKIFIIKITKDLLYIFVVFIAVFVILYYVKAVQDDISTKNCSHLIASHCIYIFNISFTRAKPLKILKKKVICPFFTQLILKLIFLINNLKKYLLFCTVLKHCNNRKFPSNKLWILDTLNFRHQLLDRHYTPDIEY